MSTASENPRTVVVAGKDFLTATPLLRIILDDSDEIIFTAFVCKQIQVMRKRFDQKQYDLRGAGFLMVGLITFYTDIRKE